MRHFTLLILFLGNLTGAYAQLSLNGRVVNEQNEPLPGANVFLEGTFSGATTDAAGQFSFEAPQAENYTLAVRYLGFKPYHQTLNLAAGASLPSLHIILEEEAAELGTVTITAGNFEASDESRAASLSAQDVYTTASALGDVVGAIQTLPGVATVGEDGRLFVRGGGGDELRLYVNGQPIGSPYGATVANVPARGRFSPALFRGFSFSSGAYGAEWGEALSAVLSMETKNLTDAPTRTDLSLMTVGASASHQQSVGSGGLVLQADYLNLGPYMALVPQQFQFHNAPQELGGALNWQQPLNNGSLSLFADGRQRALHLSQPNITQAGGQSTIKLNNQNYLGQLRWQQGLRNWGALTTAFSVSTDDTHLQPNQLNLLTSSRLLHLKTQLEADLSRSLSLSSGLEAEQQRLTETYTETDSPARHFNRQWYRPAAWSQLDWQVGKKVAARLGLRAQHSSRTQTIRLMPRLAVAYQLSPGQSLSLAAGEYSQEPAVEWLRLNPNLVEARSRQAVLSYQYEPKGRLLRAETYYKQYTHLPLLSAEGLSRNGNGWASGMEVFWRDRQSIKGGDYWLAYTFTDSRRHYANYPQAARPNFLLQHSLSMVYKHFIKKLRSQVGGSFSLASGRPYEDPNSPGFMNETAPVQQNLSLNWAYLWKENLILYTAATNVLGGGQAFTYRFSEERNPQGRYDRQAIGNNGQRFFFLGLFFTLSHNKGDNQLESL
jgi:hypothetical protein